jgi:diketogulonate reductase-like aldo/keto reductase
MSILNEFYTLRNGVNIPKIGFGTWQIVPEMSEQSVEFAIEAGYTHIDTALAYRNEEGVGRAVRSCGLSREKIFVTSKLPAEVKGYDKALKAFDSTMKNLGLEYLDLYLIHAPWPWTEIGKDCTSENIESWRAFEKLYKDGRVRAIGVSNFSPSDIEAIVQSSEYVPFVNQIAFYAGRTQDNYVKYCQERDILIEAYSPLATGRALNDPFLKDMAAKYGVSVAQLLIKFTLQRGTLPLPKSVNPLRIRENTQVDGFTVSDEDMALLNSVKTEYR